MKILLTSLFAIISVFCSAQTAWHNPQTEGAKLHGQLMQEQPRSNYYQRLPDAIKKNVREAVWRLSMNSAGETIRFYTNSPKIVVRYQVSESYALDHMPSTGKSGLDMYATDPMGLKKWCAATRNFADTITYNYSNLFYKNNFHKLGYEYELYLPTYNSVKWIEIGVDEGAYFKFVNPTSELPIIVYGTSIAQGACASRPGMIWPSIVAREMEYPLVNLGFSGNGRLEKGVLDVIKATQARAVILDCMPNIFSETKQKIIDLTTNAVREIRKSQPNVPIILTDHLGYPHSSIQGEWHEFVVKCCEANQEAFQKLLSEGYMNLHYITYNDIALPSDATVEAIHPSDWGMRVYADAYIKKLKIALNTPSGSLLTQMPVTQRRELGGYDWIELHDKRMREARKMSPKIVLLGNSIMHQWGGTPGYMHTRDSVGWAKATAGKGVINMGTGWDKVENLLWRVCHGALDGYTPQKIIVTIGVNNLNSGDSPQDISEGIRTLIKAIKIRQPKAQIKICGVFPMRSSEEKIVSLNKLIEKVTEDEGVQFGNPGANLLMTNGKADQSLYQNDGLHLNANGYRRVSEEFFK